jgi:hypothetical protein
MLTCGELVGVWARTESRDSRVLLREILKRDRHLQDQP